MAKQPYYINREGRLKRQHNTVRFEHADGHVYLPIEQISSLFICTTLDLNTKLLEFFSRKNIPIHFFNYYESYTGTFMPREVRLSGDVLIRQVLASNDLAERIPIAKEILRGAQSNIMKNIRKMQRNHPNEELDRVVEDIQTNIEKIEKTISIPQLMGIEGNIRKKYYQCIDLVMNQNHPDFVMDGRIKRPPNNRMNSLVSFVNSLVYGTTIDEIYHSHLNPTISFLHEPTTRRYSLALDISEVFKPLIADRLIFRLVNLKMLNKRCFDEMEGICYLNEKGRKKVIEEYHQRLNKTIKHRSLGRNVSYRHLIRLECFKLVKHLLGEKPYVSFKIWW